MGNAPNSRALPLVLLYHRIIALPRDPYKLCISPCNFRQHLDIIARRWQPISLRNFIGVKYGVPVRQRSVLITFDDGYNDLIETCLGLSERSIPAALFLVTDRIGSGTAFWWDLLDQLISEADTDQLAIICAKLSLRGERSWSEKRDVAFQQLYWKLRSLQEPLRSSMLAELYASTGRMDSLGKDFAPLSVDQVRMLATLPEISFGSHSRSHTTNLGYNALRLEAAESRRLLERWTGRKISAYAYPHGRSGTDYDENSTAAVSDEGFAVAFSVEPGERRGWFDVPRLTIPNLDGAQFANFLEAHWATWPTIYPS
ncbi:polysaccharide deacetylase family protein [Aurantimonas sp. VKM B-3413]|uniref:polysaccharide deacetylase family protein n=1 Tax=Aurantimonas sp. VKM B-3413 TaxID=2779401 RepID=UPI001E63ED64|nr:polysaccharide deacetylase family protein [Aurantimonas sp. VKM B-3413]MCB8836124.1 polysaccharide deacetylase family protein [Aurantimonas sp. VKM B-3413]